MKKKTAHFDPSEAPSVKKIKLSKELENENSLYRTIPYLENTSKYTKGNETDRPKDPKKVKPKNSLEKTRGKPGKPELLLEKPEDWNQFKKQKKELKLKRKQVKAKDGFDVIIKAKKLGEELRRKSLKGEEKRLQLTNELHSMLKERGHYAKFVLAHDTARLVQWLLKYGSEIVVKQIAKVCKYLQGWYNH